LNIDDEQNLAHKGLRPWAKSAEYNVVPALRFAENNACMTRTEATADSMLRSETSSHPRDPRSFHLCPNHLEFRMALRPRLGPSEQQPHDVIGVVDDCSQLTRLRR
jgi:hypothetical protein